MIESSQQGSTRIVTDPPLFRVNDADEEAKDRLRGERSENGERFVEPSANNNIVIITTLLPRKDIHKHTWASPDTRIRNQIDLVAICGKFRKSVLY